VGVEKPRMSLPGIVNMGFGFLGIQFGWTLQMANMSAIYEYLGADPGQIPILWLAAPLTGLLVQPIIGHMSDNTWCFLGRRRPYFLIGTLLATASLIFMPYCSALWMAALLLWVMDASVNISMEPFRAFVADLLPEKQRTTGYSVQSLLIGLGSVIAAALPWILTNVAGMSGEAAAGERIPAVVRTSFHIGAAAFFLAVMWTIFTTKEYPPENLDSFKEKKATGRGMFAEILLALKEMPPTMRQLAWVQIFSWMGLFCFFLYFPVAVAHNVFMATGQNTPLYLEGVEWAGICTAVYSAVCFVFSFFLPGIARKMTRKGAHIMCLLFGAAALLSMLFVTDKYVLLVLMVGMGLAWTGILSLPYAILAGALPEGRMGVYMGIFNFFITIPEILISLGFGWVMSRFLGDDRLYGVVTGGVLFLVAALFVLRVRDVGFDKRNA